MMCNDLSAAEEILDLLGDAFNTLYLPEERYLKWKTAIVFPIAIQASVVRLLGLYVEPRATGASRLFIISIIGRSFRPVLATHLA